MCPYVPWFNKWEVWRIDIIRMAVYSMEHNCITYCKWGRGRKVTLSISLLPALSSLHTIVFTYYPILSIFLSLYYISWEFSSKAVPRIFFFTSWTFYHIPPGTISKVFILWRLCFGIKILYFVQWNKWTSFQMTLN